MDILQLALVTATTIIVVSIVTILVILLRLETSIILQFRYIFESAKTTEIEEWLQWWQAAGIKFWKSAQK